MKKNSELEVGDIIEVPVSHTDRVEQYTITRVTATQYVTGFGARFNKNLKKLGRRSNRNYDVYGQQPKVVESVAESVAEPVKAEPVDATATVAVAETGAVAHPTPELTTADHVVVFETESQTRQVLEAANAYTRTAILVQNLESETYIVGVFKSKKAATEAKKNVAGVGRVFDIVVQPSGCTNKAVSFYNIVMLAHAITGENHDKLVTCEHPYWCDGAKGKLYAKIETSESQPVTQEIPESQEVTEITATPRKVKLAPMPALIDIESAQDVVSLVKGGVPVYAVVEPLVAPERDDDFSNNVSLVTSNLKAAQDAVFDDKSELSEACRLIEIRKNETFVFEEIDCPVITYAATVDAQWIMHPNGRWKIYFHDERPEDVSDCSAFEFDGWALNGEEYRIEFGVGDSDENRDEHIVFRVYAKDIMWDGKARDLVCICRHPDALPEDDMGYKRPPVNQTRILIPWLNEPECKVYEYAY